MRDQFRSSDDAWRAFADDTDVPPRRTTAEPGGSSTSIGDAAKNAANALTQDQTIAGPPDEAWRAFADESNGPSPRGARPEPGSVSTGLDERMVGDRSLLSQVIRSEGLKSRLG